MHWSRRAAATATTAANRSATRRPESATAAATALDLLARRGVDGDLEPVVDDGLDGWRAHARAERAGPFWLVPTWVAAPVGADAASVLRLDPGHTFGSGSHPTTRL
ncbi:MAG: 50S ribosomal protein L11 methyltransferase, partial [Mycobacterium sp.]|nr:50S ribosomal protein L11 methyltransferase [Mycobacterium sp.]